MQKSKTAKDFAANIAETHKSNPMEVDRYLKAHNVCFRTGTSREQFNNDMVLCINADRLDLLEYVISRDMHTAFAIWEMVKGAFKA